MRWLTVSLVGRAVISWLVPFLVSCTLFDPSGSLVIDVRTFKTVMALSFSLVNTFLLRGAINSLPLNTHPDERVTPYALRIGAFFFTVNSFLDVTLLIPFVNAQQKHHPDPETMTIGSWFAMIGIGYTTVILQAYLAGSVADKTLARMQTKKVESE